MKLAYEPGLVTGTAVGAILALLVYYRVIDTQGASLWGALAVFIVPPFQAWVTRHFTMPVAKIEDAGLHPDSITAQAKVTTDRRTAHRKRERSV